MQIIKRINTNAALARDDRGRELILLGRGVGFPQVPYELEDLSQVERTFYDVDPKYFDMLAELPKPIMLASADIADLAEMELDCELNPNLPFAIADHLSFAVERTNKGLTITTPLAYDIKHLYPKEYALGQQALAILESHSGVTLPGSEAISIALHLINAEADDNNMHDTMRIFGILNDIDTIIEQQLDIHMDKESYYYSRFVMHLRYLVQRLMSNEPEETGTGSMLRPIAREFPDVYLCAQKVCDYLKTKHAWRCNEEETLYLMLHINRVKESVTAPEPPGTDTGK